MAEIRQLENRHISTKNHLILTKFGTKQHIWLDGSQMTKYEHF